MLYASFHIAESACANCCAWILEHLRPIVTRHPIALEFRLADTPRVKTAVQLALKDAVSRVLTPKKSTDVLREVSQGIPRCVRSCFQMNEAA